MPRRSTPKPPSKPIAAFTLGDAPGHLLRRAHQRSEELFSSALGPEGPTRQQVALLVTTCQHPEATQARLVELTGIDKNTLTQMIGRLTQRGLLERRRAPDDARANQIVATPAGVKLLESVLAKVNAVQAQILAPLPVELRAVFTHCLRIVAGLE
jgi:DNA-binding MarR family transcriptional regulator